MMYKNLFFSQGEDADELLDLIDKGDFDAAFEIASQGCGEELSPERFCGIYHGEQRRGDLILSWNFNHHDVGLEQICS